MAHTNRPLKNINPEQIGTKTTRMGIFPQSNLTTNRPFLHRDNNITIHYLPCYVRFLLKEIENICAVDMEAYVFGNIIFSFAYEDTHRKLIDQFTSKDDKAPAIIMEFNKETAIHLKEGLGISMKKQDGLVQFVVRQKYKMHLRGHVFLTPFEELSMYLAVTIQPVQIQQQVGGRKVLHKFKFNCMDYTGEKDKVHVIRHLANITMGQYRVVSRHMKAAFTNNRNYPPQLEDKFCMICENHDEYKDEKGKSTSRAEKKNTQSQEVLTNEEILPFQYAHFRIPVYRYPGTSILTIFAPIQILGAIGLVMFFQEPSLSSRLATISTLILAFVAFIPTINASIPQSPTIKLVQILIFLHLIGIFLLGAQSFLSKNQDPSNYNFVWQNNAFFLVAALLNILTFLTMAFLFLVHKCLWEPRLKRPVPNILIKNLKINYSDWGNRDCDEYYKKFTDIYFTQAYQDTSEK